MTLHATSDAPPRLRDERPDERTPHIVIIGGGITGLSAAYALRGASARVTLVERASRLGGKILTDTLAGGFVVEGGPDSFVAQKPQAIELARELGLGDELMASNTLPRSTYVLSRRKLRPLPEGTVLIVPTRFMPFALSPLISPLGKLRMGMDLLIPPRAGDADETLAEFIRRRLGREALDMLAEPLMAGIHSADCERQSLLATFPRFRDMEKKHGGLIRGMLAARRGPRTTNHEPRTTNQSDVGGSRSASAVRPSPASASGTQRSFAGSPFVTLRRGVGSLVEALLPRITARIVAGRAVASLRHDPTGAQPYRLRLDDGTTLDADAVIVTTPTYAAAELLEATRPALAEALRQFRYVSTATVTLAYRRAEVGSPLDGYGVVIPRAERRRVNAVTLSSVKFDGRAPDDHLLVRVFVGGSRTPESLAHDDAGLLALVREELRAILGITAEPVFARTYRWEQANPQYDVGHQERVAALGALCPDGLVLAGGAYDGVGIPDCIRQGRAAAEAVVGTLNAKR